MLKSNLRYLLPCALVLTLSGCYINAYPPEQQTTPPMPLTPVTPPTPLIPIHGKGFNPHPMPVPVPPPQPEHAKGLNPDHAKGFNPPPAPPSPPVKPTPVKKPLLGAPGN